MHHSQPLAGRRILLPRRRDSRLASTLRDAGAVVDEVALINRTPVPSPALHELAADLRAGSYQWLAITSSFTVEALARLSYPLYDLLAPGLRIAAVGRATAAVVRTACGRVDLVPSEGVGAQALAADWPPGIGRVAIPGSFTSADTLHQVLTGAGWQVRRVGIYRTAPVSSVPADVTARWRAGDYDAIIVTAGSVATAAASLLGPDLPVVAIGSPSAVAASRAGFHPVVIARTVQPADILAALIAAVD